MIHFLDFKLKNFIGVNRRPSLAKTYWIVLGLGFSLCRGAWAETTASWLNLPSSARQAAFSGALGALADDLDALGVNPAGLAAQGGPEISVLHNQWAQNLSVEHLALGRGFGTWGAALGGDYYNFGSVPLYDLTPLGTPVSNGTFTPLAMDFAAGAGLEIFPGMSLGADAKIIFQSLVNGVTSSGEAVDLGFLYRNRPSGLSVGMAMLNLGSAMDGADLPLGVHLSAAFQNQLAIGHEISLGAEGGLGLADGGHFTFGAGAEYWYQWVVALRAGYRAASYGNLEGLAGLSAGVGVKLGQAELSYALTTLGDLGMGHQVSLSYLFESEGFRTPSAPAGLEAGMEDGKMELSWEAVREIGVVGYNFYLKRPGEKDFKKISSNPLRENSVSLARIKMGKTYQFGVTTVGRDGRESAMSILALTP